MTILKRVPAGKLSGLTGDIGTILGPKVVTREFVVITSNGSDANGKPYIEVGYATQADLEAVFTRSAQSLTELRMQSIRKNGPNVV